MDLFDERRPEQLAPGAMFFPGRALATESQVLRGLQFVVSASPFRHFETRRGFKLFAAMTNCGKWGWVSDRRGYRYQEQDPKKNAPWPSMPRAFLQLAERAASEAGFSGYTPDCCLVNRYAIGAKMGLHQDADEIDFEAPIVSVSLGLPAVFQFGGAERRDPVRKLPLRHGDVLVWGGPSRLNYHGILPVKSGDPIPGIGPYRVNLTFRKAS